MSNLDSAVEALLEFRREGGFFCSYPEEAITEGKKLCAAHGLEEVWQERIGRYVSIHTEKTIEILKLFSVNQEIIDQSNGSTNKVFDFSEDDAMQETTTGLFCKLVITAVDSTLYAMILGYRRIRGNPTYEAGGYLDIVRKKIIKSIQHHDLIRDPSNLAWALHLWKEDEKGFEKVFKDLNKEQEGNTTSNFSSNGRNNFPMKSWEELIEVCISRLNGSSEKYVEALQLPPSEKEEFYSGACRPTAYMFLNLKRISQLFEDNSTPVCKRINDTVGKISSWIRKSYVCYKQNPYLLALYIECLCEGVSEEDKKLTRGVIETTLAVGDSEKKAIVTIKRIIVLIIGFLVIAVIGVLAPIIFGEGGTFLIKANSIAVLYPILGLVYTIYTVCVLGGWAALKKWTEKRFS